MNAVPVAGDAQMVATGVKAELRHQAAVSIDVVNAPLASVLKLIARQAGLQVSYDEEVVGAAPHVTVRVQSVAADVAFSKVLSGTGMQAVLTDGRADIVRRGSALETKGIIVGRVTDARTKQPVRGVTVLVDEAKKGVVTNDAGEFRIAGVEAGSHVVRIRMLNYGKQSKTVTVADATEATVNFAVEASVNTLDQVVVTGTVVATELKAIPTSITIITAKELEQRGITHIDQLFRGDVPGVFAQNNDASDNPFHQVTMFSRGATSLATNASSVYGKDGTVSGTNPIKTYVDGVEMADPSYLSQIDPKSIERIEILTGPQASTIYGSNALNGVMQIFTKRGQATRPQFTMDATGGVTQNNFSSSLAPRYRLNAGVNGVDRSISYNIGGTGQYTGAWTPGIRTTTYGTNAGLRYQHGAVTMDGSLRLSSGQNKVGGSYNEDWTSYVSRGLFVDGQLSIGHQGQQLQNYSGQTLGVTLGYAPWSWWSSQLTIGSDVSQTASRTGPSYSYNDTGATMTQGQVQRQSVSYTTTLLFPVTDYVNVTMTAGADEWHGLSTSQSFTSNTTLNGSFNGASVSRQPNHNAGGFLQGQLGVWDAVFFTYGVRSEWNPQFGDKQQGTLSPRYGIAATQSLGMLTTKIRASYGRSTRPPGLDEINGQLITDPYSVSIFGHPFQDPLPSPSLGPETQQGIDAGLDFYIGNLGSLQITRSNQTVSNLIDRVTSDSLRSVMTNPHNICTFAPYACHNNYYYAPLVQYLNVANIRNQSWELVGRTSVGPVSAGATYTWTKSRSLGMTPRFAAQFPARYYPLYQAGATFQLLPEHTWAFDATYARSGRTIGINVTGIGRIRNLENEFFDQHLNNYIRLMSDRYNIDAGGLETYYAVQPPYEEATVNAAQRVSSRVELTLQIQNLMNAYHSDITYVSPVAGRMTQFGIRIR